MNRLQAELQRLYVPPDAQPGAPGPGTLCLAGEDGRARGMVFELAGSGAWTALGPVWQGVQADLQLPAPAIAVSGSGAFQLWFSLAQPVAAAEAHAFLRGLQRRYLAETPPERVALCPSGAPGPQDWRAPPFEAGPGRWSAFVAPDLAALFADEPWLDLEPGAEAQAELLSDLRSMAPAEWQQALARLDPVQPAQAPAGAAAFAPPAQRDPRQFLLDVMNDGAVDLRLRIEAAKALLPHAGR